MKDKRKKIKAQPGDAYLIQRANGFYWGMGGSTQYKYSKKELFYLTQGQ